MCFGGLGPQVFGFFRWLGVSKTVISGKLVHDYSGLGCDDCGRAVEKLKEHQILLRGV